MESALPRGGYGGFSTYELRRLENVLTTEAIEATSSSTANVEQEWVEEGLKGLGDGDV